MRLFIINITFNCIEDSRDTTMKTSLVILIFAGDHIKYLYKVKLRVLKIRLFKRLSRDQPCLTYKIDSYRYCHIRNYKVAPRDSYV